MAGPTKGPAAARAGSEPPPTPNRRPARFAGALRWPIVARRSRAIWACRGADDRSMRAANT